MAIDLTAEIIVRNYISPYLQDKGYLHKGFLGGIEKIVLTALTTLALLSLTFLALGSFSSLGFYTFVKIFFDSKLDMLNPYVISSAIIAITSTGILFAIYAKVWHQPIFENIKALGNESSSGQLGTKIAKQHFFA